jgi:hypothetical protein
MNNQRLKVRNNSKDLSDFENLSRRVFPEHMKEETDALYASFSEFAEPQGSDRPVRPVPQDPLPEIKGPFEELPLHFFDFRCFAPLDLRLQVHLGTSQPNQPETRSMALMWLHWASVTEGRHWTEYVEYYDPDGYDFIEDINPYIMQRTAYIDADPLVTNVLSMFEEEYVETLDDETLLEFDSDDLIKCLDVPETYDASLVADTLLEKGMNVVSFEGRSIGIYPVGSVIPNNFKSLRHEVKNGIVPTSLQAHLISYALEKGCRISHHFFRDTIQPSGVLSDSSEEISSESSSYDQTDVRLSAPFEHNDLKLMDSTLVDFLDKHGWIPLFGEDRFAQLLHLFMKTGLLSSLDLSSAEAAVGAWLEETTMVDPGVDPFIFQIPEWQVCSKSQ